MVLPWEARTRCKGTSNFLKTFELSVQFWLGIGSYPRSLTAFGWGYRLAAHVDFLLFLIFSFCYFLILESAAVHEAV